MNACGSTYRNVVIFGLAILFASTSASAQLLSDEPDLETCGEAEDVYGAIQQV